VFIEQNPEPTISADSPDTALVAELCNRYYPVILSHHAPLQSATHLCYSQGCRNSGPFYSCISCFKSSLYCRECIKCRHEDLPFHRINLWNTLEKCYTPITWCSLEMVWSLHHEDGTTCTARGTVRNMQTLHVNGVHNIPYYLCTCFLNAHHHQTASPTQLLANKMFPATSNSPVSAFTFELLEHFDALNLSGFINIKQYCDTMIELTPREVQNHNEVG